MNKGAPSDGRGWRSGALDLSRTSLRLIGIAMILLGATKSSSVVSGVAVTIGIVIAVWSMRTRLASTSGSEHRWAAIISIALMTGMLGPFIASRPASIVQLRPLAMGVGLVACAVAFFAGHQVLGRRVSAVLSMSVAVVILVALIGSEWSSTMGSDVYHAHRGAGAALKAGENPYTDAVIFADGNPFAPEDRIFEGYPYPPVTLSAYGLAGAFTDPRLISAVSLLGFLGWLAVKAWGARADESPGVGLSALLVMSLAPLGSEVWYMAWTEPLTLFLFLMAVLAWKRSPVVSGILLGVALASKQYLIVLLPLVLLHRDVWWRRRSVTAILTTAFTLLVGLLPNPDAFVQATITNLTTIGFRPDTQSLSGLINQLGSRVILPNWLWIMISLILVGVLATSSRTRSGFATRAGLGLGIAFLLGLAFPNYWFLVAGLLTIGTVLEVVDAPSLSADEGGFRVGQGRRQETRIAGV